MRISPTLRRVTAGAAALALLATAYSTGSALGRSGPGADTVDEIHFSYGNSARSVVLDWRGAANTVFYGRTRAYGKRATAHPPATRPPNGPGPFREVALTGLRPGTRYHYRIGSGGADHTLATAPVRDFGWVDVGDTMSTSCGPDGSWMRAVHRLVASQNPDFVTHGGDIAVPNQCGLASLHRYYVDQQVWSTHAAFQIALGNHEHGRPAHGAPRDAITDSLANYKGRSFVTHGQSVPGDRAGTTTYPGCGAEVGRRTNTCHGEDWGWFRAGGVLFISYPEPSWRAWQDWQGKAGALMARAQRNAAVDFVVTWGHRPAWSTSAQESDPGLRSVLSALARRWSPTPAHPHGKYVLTVGHHAHGMEAFARIGGLTSITSAAGGQGLVPFTRSDRRSVWRTRHLGLLSGRYDASRHTLSVKMKCGPVFRHRTSDACQTGSTLWSTRFVR